MGGIIFLIILTMIFAYYGFTATMVTLIAIGVLIIACNGARNDDE